MIKSLSLDELVKQKSSWLEAEESHGPVISSRVRLARNINAYHFPGWAKEEQHRAVWQQSVDLFTSFTAAYIAWEMESLSALDREALFERHLISQELLQIESSSGVFVSEDETMAVMINEEDHIRIQSLQAGLNVKAAWQEATAIDDRIEEQISYAYSSKFGYLTSCPSNVGTGLRSSVMLHLPGLVMLEEIDSIVNGISKIGLAVRGMWGEGSEAIGNMFQISNQITLGKKETDIIEHLEQIVLELIEHEQNARERLYNENESLLKDHIWRAYGILSHANAMSSSEAINLTSAIRLGLDMGLLDGLSRQEMDRLFIAAQPAHLQLIEQAVLDEKERDIVRASMLRNRMKDVQLKNS